MNFVVSAAFIGIALGVQYFLSYRSNPYLGAIIPIVFTAGMTWRYFNGEYNSFLAYVLLLGFGLVLLLQEWSRGRKKLKKNQEKELEKMRMHDIN